MYYEYISAIIAVSVVCVYASRHNFKLFLKITGVCFAVLLALCYKALWNAGLVTGTCYQIIPAGAVSLLFASLCGWALSSTSLRPEWLND